MRVSLASALSTAANPSWLVDSMLATGYLTILAGTPGTGKSYLAYTLALSVAAGVPFLGHPVRKGPVVYLDEENGDDAYRYVRELLPGLPGADPLDIDANFHWFMDELGSRTVDDRYDRMRAIVERVKPVLIVIDTGSQALGIRDENDNAEAARHIGSLRSIRAAADPLCTILLLKHARVDPISGKRDVRGAKAWVGSSNAVWGLYRPGRGRPRAYGPTVLEAIKARAGSFTGSLDIIPHVKNYGRPDQSVSLGAQVRPEPPSE